MLRYVLLTCMYMYVYVGMCQAQVTFQGPKEAKPNKLTKIAVTAKGNDLQIQGFVDGKPTTEDWALLKEPNDQLVILLLTDRPGVYTFVGGVSLENRTLLTNHFVQVGQPSPKPPAPTPNNSTLSEKLKAEYQKSPDQNSLGKLLAIFEEVVGKQYTNFDQMEKVHTAAVEKFLPGNELRGVRDILQSYLLEKLGADPRRTDITKAKEVYTEIISALKGL
jgi:hypothetical protein